MRAREYELHALRQQLLHTRGHAGLDVRRQLVVSRLADIAEPADPEASVMPPSEASVRAALEEHFARLPVDARWGEAERVLGALIDRGVIGPGAAMRLTPLLSSFASPDHHLEAWSRLMGIASASTIVGTEAGDPASAPIDPLFLDAASRARRGIASSVDGRAMEARIAALTVGPRDAAAHDVAALLVAVEPRRRRGVVEVLWRGATAWRAGEAERIIIEDEAALSAVLRVAAAPR